MKGQEPGPWQKELDDFVRAFSGAFLFGTPLLFTMEMWWLGEHTEPRKLLVLLLVAFVANLGLAYFAGFKEEGRFGNHLDQAVDAVAVGVVASAAVLLVLNRIRPGDPLDTILAKIILQTVPLSIGASVSKAVFARGRDRQSDEEGPPPRGFWEATFNDVGATTVGGVFIGFSIAPTEEVPMLAAELTPGHELALIGLSLILTYAIVFASGFDPRQRHPKSHGLFRTPASETAMAYLVSLVVAFGALYLFNQVDFEDPVRYVISQVLVLGVPTAIGGAAGRVVL